MKKIIPLIILLIIAIGIFAVSINYRNNKTPEAHTDSTGVSYSVREENTKLEKEDIIAENKEGNYQLYFKNNIATLVHNKARIDFTSWGKSIATKNPELYYSDFDKDGEKELIIKLVENGNNITGKTEYSYILYMFKPEKDENGDEQLKYITASSQNWTSVFSSYVKLEITQLKNCKKFLQFAMNDSTEEINYDSKTGITDNKYVAYGKADCSNKKEYYTVSGYNKGIGVYNVDENGKITLDIQIIVKYEESSLNYHIGNIHCDMKISDNTFLVEPNTISLKPLEEYSITDPRETADADWNYTVNNRDASANHSANIGWIEKQFTLNAYNSSENQNFSDEASDIEYIDKIEFTQSGITMTAQDGCSFDKAIIENGKFEVLTGEDFDTDISYNAEIKNINEKSTLILHFDKTYNKSDIASIAIKCGN
ncbi:MAG: hypothetical protein NC397_05110 [Clostridium sp.]|nr:hypothetical protein [Clostridium sp.]